MVRNFTRRHKLPDDHESKKKKVIYVKSECRFSEEYVRKLERENRALRSTNLNIMAQVEALLRGTASLNKDLNECKKKNAGS